MEGNCCNCGLAQCACCPIKPLKNMRLPPHYPAIQETTQNPLVFVGQKRKISRRWRCKTKEKDSTELVRMKPKLNHPVGVAFGTFNINDFMLPEDKSEESLSKVLPLQAYATCMLAFGETFITPEEEWNGHVLNRVLQEGSNLLINSQKLNNNEAITSFSQILKCFSLCMNTMEVGISEPIVIGMMQCPNSRVYSFGIGISMFMQKFKYCLVNIENQFFLIWKQSKGYFLFDCYGRAMNCERDTKFGSAALMCACGLQSMDVLLTYMGCMDPDFTYTLYEIRMKRLSPCCVEPFVCSGISRIPEYQIVSEQHAKIEAGCHIAAECFKEGRYKQALAMGLISMIYSKIDAPCTWNTSIVDKILITGDRCYKEWTQFNPEKCLFVQDIPGKIMVGQFMAEIVIFPTAYCGTWLHLPDYRVSEITWAINNFFTTQKCLNILIQIDRKAYAIWKRHGFYYLFDPYPQEILPATVKDGSRRNATLHMFSTLKLLCCTFIQDIIKVPTPSAFFIHVVKILNLHKLNVQSLPDDPLYSSVNPNIDMAISETDSLNESIFDIKCEETLKCATEIYDTGGDDLDGPPISETQNVGSYEQAMGGESQQTSDSESLDEEEGEQDDSEDGEGESDGSNEDDEGDSIKGKSGESKGGKGGKVKDGKGKGGKGKGGEGKGKGQKGKGIDEKDIDKEGKSKEVRSSLEEVESKEKSTSSGDIDGKKKPCSKEEVSSLEGIAEKQKKDKDKRDHRKKGKSEKARKVERDSKGKKRSNEKNEESAGKDGKGEPGKGKDSKEDVNKEKDGEKESDKGEDSMEEVHRGEGGDRESGKGKDSERKAEKGKGGERESSKGKDSERPAQKGKNSKEGASKGKHGKGEADEGKTGKAKGGKVKHGIGIDDEDESDDETDDELELSRDDVSHLSFEECEEDESDSNGSDSRWKGDGSSSDTSRSRMGGTKKRGKDGSGDEGRRWKPGDGCATPPGGWPPGAGCMPNSYPGYMHIPRNLAVIGSASGTYQSLCQLIRSALKVADRMLTMTPWGNYVVFKNCGSYLLYDGCTCNPCRFRNIDLTVGTAGLLCFSNLHELILEILKGKNRPALGQTHQLTVEKICEKYC